MFAFVVALYPSSKIWRVRALCPYCGKIHKHGGGYRTDTPNLGYRGSECGQGDYELIVDSGSIVCGLPSTHPLVVKSLSNRLIQAGNGTVSPA